LSGVEHRLNASTEDSAPNTPLLNQLGLLRVKGDTRG